jgi:hypothetical protein
MVVFRRFLVLVALMFWLGGFTFYAGVVVPIGRQVIGSAQSDVTQQVSGYLNLSCFVALVPLLWDCHATRDSCRRRRLARWFCCAAILVTLAALLVLYGALVSMLHQPDGASVKEGAFRMGHRAYLWVSTLQWLAGVVYTFLTIRAWRAEDLRQGVGSEG